MVLMSLARKVWFITGASQGLGRQIALAALARKERVIATARDISRVRDLENAFNTKEVDLVRAMELDVTVSEDELRSKAADAVGVWGRMDVLVNNAGVGMPSISEEAGQEGYMRQFKTNFFGPINLTNAFLPYMRRQREGAIVFIGSRSSWRARVPLFGPYASSKAALEACAEALKEELTPLGIRVLTVLPGGLRTTNWVNMVVMPPASGVASLGSTPSNTGTTANTTPKDVPEHKSERIKVEEGRIADYAQLRVSALKWMYDQDGVQVGDPVKAAEAIVDVVRGEGLTSPSHLPKSTTRMQRDVKGQAEQPWPDMLVLGEDAEQNIRDRCQTVLRCLDDWKDVTRSIAFKK